VKEIVYLFVFSLLVAGENSGCLRDDGGTKDDLEEVNERIREVQDDITGMSVALGRKIPFVFIAFALLPGVLLLLCYFALSALVLPRPLYLVFTAACFILNARGEARVIDRIAKIAAGRIKEWPDKRAVVISRLESGAAFVHALATAALCLQKMAALR